MFVGINLVGGVCFAADKNSLGDATAADADRLARVEEKRVLESLTRRIELECQDLSLDDTLQQLSRLIDREIIVDREKLSDEGISLDQSVSLELGEITAWQTLHFLLKPMNLTWVANDGVIEITTKTHAEELFVTRVYDVQNLCKLLDPLSKDLSARKRRTRVLPGGAGTGVGGGGGGGFFSVPIVAPRIGQTTVEIDGQTIQTRMITTVFVRGINVLGLPALSIPVGRSQSGLPIGAQLVGRPFEDSLVLKLGKALEGAL